MLSQIDELKLQKLQKKSVRTFNNINQHRTGPGSDPRHQTLNSGVDNLQGYKGSHMMDEERQGYPLITDR